MHLEGLERPLQTHLRGDWLVVDHGTCTMVDSGGGVVAED